MKILVNFPTRTRPEKFKEVVDMWLCPEVAIVATIDKDDKSMVNDPMLNWCIDHDVEVQIIEPAGKIAAMNAGLSSREWDICIIGQDDLIPRAKYATKIIALWKKHFGESTDGILHLDDGNQTGSLNTIVVIGRQYYNRFGYVYHPSYISLWADNEYSDVSTHLMKVVRINRRVITHEWAGQCPDNLLRHNETFDQIDKMTYARRKALGFPLEAVPK